MLMRLFTLAIMLLVFSFVSIRSEDGYVYYQKAVAAKTIGERESNFEKALKAYMAQLADFKKDNIENGYLYYNIGNCYFNLNQIGEAILYYKQAQKYLPYDEKVLKNIEIAKQKRDHAVDITKQNELLETLLFFHYKFSTKQKYLLLFVLSLIALLSFMGLQKKSVPVFKKSLVFSLFFYGVMLCSVGLDYYAPQHEGVLVEGSMVYQDAGENFSSLTEKPLSEGSSLRVLSLKDRWYKVQLNDGRVGFVKEQNLKLVL